MKPGTRSGSHRGALTASAKTDLEPKAGREESPVEAEEGEVLEKFLFKGLGSVEINHKPTQAGDLMYKINRTKDTKVSTLWVFASHRNLFTLNIKGRIQAT